SGCQVISKKSSHELFTEGGVVPYYKPVNIIDAWLDAQNVPALGFSEIAWPPAPVIASTVSVDRDKLDNDQISVQVGPDGSITASVAGRTYKLKHSIRDHGDGGDTY